MVAPSLAQEILTVDGVLFSIGESIPLTAESMFALESVRQLVVAYRVDDAGEQASMARPKQFILYPRRPADMETGANAQQRREHTTHMQGYYDAIDTIIADTRLAKNLGNIALVLPTYGYIRTFPQQNSFHIYDRNVPGTQIINYANDNRPTHFLIHEATIVE